MKRAKSPSSDSLNFIWFVFCFLSVTCFWGRIHLLSGLYNSWLLDFQDIFIATADRFFPWNQLCIITNFKNIGYWKNLHVCRNLLLILIERSIEILFHLWFSCFSCSFVRCIPFSSSIHYIPEYLDSKMSNSISFLSGWIKDHVLPLTPLFEKVFFWEKLNFSNNFCQDLS